jgi:hypothetical protein
MVTGNQTCMKTVKFKTFLSALGILLSVLIMISPFLFKQVGFTFFFSIILTISLLLLGSLYFLKSSAVWLAEEYKYKYIKILLFFLVLVYFAIAWRTVANRYMHPGQSVYTNSDYYYIKHTGFLAKDSFALIDDKNYNNALFDDLKGRAVVYYSDPDTVFIKTNGLETPFFYSISSESNTEFLNPYFTETLNKSVSISDGTMSVTLRINKLNKTQTSYTFEINGKSFISEFNKPINAGFPNLKTIFKSTTAPENLVDSLTWLDGCMLIKSDYNFERNENAGANSRYHFFPSPTLRQLINQNNIRILLDETVVPHINRENIKNISGHRILLRTGTQLDGDALYEIIPTNKQLNITKNRPFEIYRFPKLKNIPAQINLNVTSQSDFSTWKSKYVFHPDILHSPNHKLHINGILSFISDKEGVSPSPHLLDFNTIDSLRYDSIQAGKEFLLSTLQNIQKAPVFFWKFKLENTIKQNPVSDYWISMFPVWFLISFTFYILYNYKKQNFTFPVLEFSLHLILLIFLTLKLWLLWRYYAFPPDAAEGSYKGTGIGKIFGISTTSMVFMIPPVLFLLLSLFYNIKRLDLYSPNFTKKFIKIQDYFWCRALYFIAFIVPGALLVVLKKVVFKSDNAVSLFIVISLIVYLFIVFLNNKGIISTWVKWAMLLSTTAALAFAESGLSVVIAHGIACYFIIYFAAYRSPIRKNSIWVFQIIALTFCFLFLIPGFNRMLWSKVVPILNEKGISENTKFRASILSQSPEQAYLSTGSNKLEVTRFFNAYDNLQFVEYYSNIAPNVIQGNYMLQPYQQTGVNYKNQASDLVLSRYVVAEHGKGLARILVLLLFFPLAVICFYILRQNDIRKLRPYFDVSAFSACLLFMWSYYLYACNFNILPFVGQDFPFVSITSYTTYFVPLVLIFSILFFYHFKPTIYETDESLS